LLEVQQVIALFLAVGGSVGTLWRSSPRFSVTAGFVPGFPSVRAPPGGVFAGKNPDAWSRLLGTVSFCRLL
jgi:hypothetical protein